jgi:hypothetical protein
MQYRIGMSLLRVCDLGLKRLKCLNRMVRPRMLILVPGETTSSLSGVLGGDTEGTGFLGIVGKCFHTRCSS